MTRPIAVRNRPSKTHHGKLCPFCLWNSSNYVPRPKWRCFAKSIVIGPWHLVIIIIHVTYIIIIYVISYQMPFQNLYIWHLSVLSVHSSNIRRSCNIVDRPFRKPYWLLLNRFLINHSITLHGMLVKLTGRQFDKSKSVTRWLVTFFVYCTNICVNPILR